MLYSIHQQIWKTWQWPQDWKRSVFIPIPKKGNAKECSNYCTTALISHASTEKAMAPHSSTLAWKIPWTEELVGCSPWGRKESDTTERLIWSDAFSKSSLTIWEFSVHVVLKSSLENFEHYFASMWDECNCLVVWTFFGIAFLWDWNEYWPFPVLWPLLSIPNLPVYWVRHFNNIIF